MIKFQITNSKLQTNSKFQFPIFKIAILLTLCALLVPGELDALMSADKERGAQEISISPDRYEEFTYETYDKEEAPFQEEAEEPMSKEENDAVERKIAEEIKEIKEEKRRIIEEEKEDFPTFPGRMRPFVAKEEVVEPPPSKPKGVEPLERHNVIMGERPFLLGLVLLALCIIIYNIYKFTKRTS